MVGGRLLGCFFAVPLSLTKTYFSYPYLGQKGFIVIGSFFPGKTVGNLPRKIPLHHLLEDSLAIEKELFMFYIIQYKTPNKIFCISKSTIQINSSDQCFQRIRYDGISSPSAGQLLSLSHAQIFPQI